MSYSDYEDDSEPEAESRDPIITSLVNACKYGNLNKVREIVEKEGNELLQKRDEEGHTFVHWAALGGSNDVLEFLLDRGCPINQHSENDYGPKPIHWACVHGHVVTLDIFLERGVPLDSLDLNGCTPLIISAQYGQSLCISYLLQKGANKFHLDNNGDSALHWAAFKGHPEAVYLLLAAGLDAKEKDSYGQTPLHSACLKGDVQCCEYLLEHGGMMDDPDRNGKTPRQLAKGRRHRMLLKYFDTNDHTRLCDWRVLQETKENGKRALRWTLVFGPGGKTRSSSLFFVCAFFFWTYPIYFFKIVPVTLADHYNVHLIFWVFSILLWIIFPWAKFSNPGIIKTNKNAYDEAVKMIGNPSSWGDYTDINNPIYNICHTCKVVRPVRAKHCRDCNRCIEEFDHHCRWLNNCVGVKNRIQFTLFLWILSLNGLLGAYFNFYYLKLIGLDVIMFMAIIFFIAFSFSGAYMLYYNFKFMLTNLTLNEDVNYTRYRHFKTMDGKYKNPFNRGVLLNILEYWHIIQNPLTTTTKKERKITNIV